MGTGLLRKELLLIMPHVTLPILPDGLIVQTHSHRVADAIDVFKALAARCDLRVHISIESDRALLPAVYEANHKRNADEPLRFKLTFMAERVEAARRLTAARDAGRVADEPAAYTDAAQLERDLQLVRNSMVTAGATQASRMTIDPLIATVRAHGFHGYLMDVRDHAQVHTAALDDIAAQLGINTLAGSALRAELSGRRPLVNAHLPLSENTERVLDTFCSIDVIQKEMGERAASTYIVSMTAEPPTTRGYPPSTFALLPRTAVRVRLLISPISRALPR